MTTKSFQAETIMEALQMVQKEMGPDAVVISARNVPIGPAWQVWKKPGVEVISMSPDAADKAQVTIKTKTQANAVLQTSKNGSGVEFIEERPAIEWDTDSAEKELSSGKQQAIKEDKLSEQTTNRSGKNLWQPCHLRKEDVQGMHQTTTYYSQGLQNENENYQLLNQSKDQKEQPATLETDEQPYPGVLNRILEKLERQGIASDYLEQLGKLALEVCSPSLLKNEEKVKKFIADQLTANLVIRKWPNTDVPGRVLVFIGLSGNGKTNSLAKVAVYYSSLLNKKVVWVCADTVRTGAISEAKSYTQAIGIPLELVYTPEDVKSILERHSEADLILVDTPGFNPVVEQQEVELGSLLVEIPDAQNLLVISATAKESDLMSCYNSLKYFGLKGCVISKLDETLTLGSIFNFSRKSHLPLTFFTSSRKASKGLKVANAEVLVDALLGKGW